MNKPVKTLLLGLGASVLFAAQIPAALVLNETFNYSDGALTQVSSGTWSNHSGTALQVDVSGGKVNLTQAESEDVNRLLDGSPHASGLLYASFIVNFSAPPQAGDGTYFASFKDDGTINLRGRVFATVLDAAAGSFRVGVANGGGAAVIITRDLALGTDYLLVLRYDTATGASTLWINPGSEASTADRADGTDSASAPGITTFALRQSSATGGMGVLTLDDLKIGTSFTDVASPPVPPAIVTQPANQIVCAGAPAGFTVGASGTSPLTYQWYFNETTPITEGTNVSFSISIAQAANAGDYSVVVTNSAGSVTSVVATLTVNPAPAVAVNSEVLCAGGSATLTATTAAASPTFLWSPGGETTASITVSPSSTTIYTCTVTDGMTGCSGSGAGTATVNSLPAVSVNSASVCDGGLAILTATTSAANPSYLWSPGGATTASITVSPALQTTYTCQVTDGVTGCTNSASGTVSVGALPTVSVNSSSICPGGMATLAATTSASNPSYLWSPGGETTASIIVSPASTTTYSVTVTDGGTGCAASALGTVTVKSPAHFVAAGAVTFNDNAAASPYPSTINVSGLTATVCRVTVTLSNLSHAFPDDIDIILVGPNGQGVFLMSDVGGGVGISGTTLTFDDEAASALPNNGPILSGTFKPTNVGGKEDGLQDLFPSPAPVQRYLTNLTAFGGINPNGAWSLYAVDDEPVDAGTLGGWSLALTTLTPFADVGILQTASPAPVGVGSNLTFVITVTNLGPAAASAVTLSDPIPANATFVSASSTVGACGEIAGTVTCAFGDLAPGAAAVVTLVLSPNSAGAVMNSPTATSSTLDFTTANNSTSSSIIVLDPPMITTAPANSVICAGGPAMFAVTATGEPPLTYAWLLNGSPIPGATSPTYSIASGQLADGGTYTVVVANAVGAATASATLTVNPLPIVGVNSETICLGASATLTATHNAASPIFLWSPGGETTASIVVSPAETTNYSVVVTDGVTGCSGSASGTVTVTPLTAATPIQSYTNICPGTAITFNTTASGTPPFAYVWRKDGNVIAGEVTGTLNLPSVLLADGGTYSVVVSGTCGSVTNSGTLTVVAPPGITSQPQNQTTPMGNGAVFSVTATGVAPLTYQWQLNGADVAGETGSSLSVSNLTLADSGRTYRVIATTCGGSTTSAVAVLSVTPVSGISFDFDTPGQYTNAPYYLTYNNWINGGYLPGIPAPTVFESAIGGVGPFPGGGGLDMSPNQGTESTSILLPVNFDFSLTGKTVFASTMFKIKSPITAGRRATQFGLVTATNLGINDQTPQGFATVIVQAPTAGTPSYELRTQRRTSGGGLQESVVVAATPLTVSNWYKLNVAFLNTKSASSPSNYTMMASLQDMGPLGTTPGATNASFTTTTNNADIVNFKNVYLALRSFEDGGMEARDNTYVWTTPGNIFFVQAPQGQIVAQGNRAQFRALVDGEGPYTYAWQRGDGSGGFTNIPQAGSWNYVTPPARTSDNGAQIRVVVTGPANTLVSDPVNLTVTPQPLAVVSAGSVDGTTVGVLFNQPVDPATAENAANYTVNGVNPSNARVYRSSLGALGPEGIYVVLTPASVVSGAFTVVATGVQDLSGGSVGAANTANGTVAGLTGFDVNPAITGPPGGNHSFGPGQFIISGGGPDIAGAADGFRFVYTTRSGDFDIKARVPYMDTIRFVSKAGINARVSLDPFSPMVVASFNPGPMAEGSGTLRQFSEGNVRNTWNAGAIGWGNNTRMFHPDVWLRLRRAGNTFIRYSSTNGINWTFDGQTSPTTLFPPTIYVGLAVSAVRNLFTESAQFENYGEFGGYPGAAIAITAQPTNFTVAAGSSFTDGLRATLTGGGAPAGAGELSYIWQRNDGSGTFTNLATAGATNNTVTIGPLFASDNGAQFRAIVRAPGATDGISDTFTATVTDTAAPTLASANGAILPSSPVSEVSLIFSENVSAATATDVASYTVTNAAGVRLNVLSATFLNGDPRNIVLKVDGQLGSGNSAVGITGVRDLNNNAIANTVRSFRSFLPSTAPVVVEVYQDVGAGTAVTDLTTNALYTGGTPTFICYSNSFGYNVPSGFGSIQDNYGVKAYSYFVPPTNGNYKFWIRSDDALELRLNSTGTDPAGAALIAANTGANGNYSVGTTPANSVTNIALLGGQPYYLEARLKEGAGGDGFSVTWTDPTVNTAPAVGTLIPTTALAYPSAVAPSTPVVMDLFTGYQNFIPGFNQLAGLTAATNFPTGNYALEVVNFKYIAGVPDVIGYQKYFGVQPGTLGNTRLDNYLGRIQTYFIAPSNGLYRFWIGVDDVAQLYMNTNAVNSTDPAGMVFLGQSANAFVSTASQLVAQNVPLVGGQKYYLMALWREGGGGDGIRVAVRSQNDGATPPTTEVIPASMLEYPLAVGRAGAVNFAGIVPASPMVPDGQSITLSASGIVGAPLNAAGSVNGAPYGYIWLKNGVRVMENTFTNITPPLTMADNGAVYTLVVTNWFSRAERSVTITVLPDSTAPTVANTVGWRYGDGFNIVYSEPVEAASATFLGNYQVSGGLTILSATLDPSRKMVSFRTTPQAAGTTYTITINGVKDASSSGNAIVANTLTMFSTWTIGGSGFLVELFTNIPNATVIDLTGTPKFINNQPDVVYYTNIFGVGLFAGNSLLENYGARITGYFIPTVTSFYRFYVRSDDASQLWMNINPTDSESPDGRTMLIHMPNPNVNVNDPRAISPPVALNAGQRYYTEALMKEGGGGDYLQVIFRQTDAAGTSLTGSPTDNTVAENSTIAMFGGSGAPGNPDAIQIIQTPPPSLTVGESDLVTLSLVANVPVSLVPATTYQWQKFDGAAYTNIPGATTPALAFFATLADDMAQYRLQFSAPGRSAGYVTLLRVTNDITAPYIVSASSLDGKTIGVCYNERVEVNTATDVFNYEVNDGAVFVTQVALRPDGRTVVLTLETPISGSFTLDATNVIDLSQAANMGGGNVIGRVQNYSPLDVGAPTAVGSSFSCVEGEIDVIAGGADIWGNSDQGHLTLTARSGNFDIHARVQSLSRSGADNSSKAGLMVRETLDANSRTLNYLVTPPLVIGGRNIFEAGQRSGTAGATAAWAGGNDSAAASTIPNAWIRIKREGNLFTGYRSVDGVNWTMTTSQTMALSNTVYIGFGTTAHNNAGPAVLAEYRDTYIPDPPTILIQPAPAAQTVAINSAVNYSVTASNPPNSGSLTYQWLRNGSVLPGQTNSTLALGGLASADSGIYSVNAANDGGGVTSVGVTLIVSNALPVVVADSLNTTQNVAIATAAADLLANDSDPEGASLALVAVSGLYPSMFESDFNAGLPAGAAIFGNATAETSGGVDNSGYIRLNPAVASQAGSLVLDEITPRRRVSAFTASFSLRIAEGSAEPADGFSFNFAPDIVIGTSGGAENGVGNGLSFCVDNYRFAPYPAGGNANTSGLKLRYGGVDIAGVVTPTWNRNSWVPVTVSVDAGGNVRVIVDGTNVFGNVVVPWVPRVGRFGFYARTGGAFESHAIDDLRIATVLTVETSRETDIGGSLFGNAYIDGGFLHLNDSAASVAGSFILNELTPGNPATSFTANFNLRIGNGSAEPADGFSLNFASDLPLSATTPAAAENGAGTGFSFCVDNYRFAPYPAGGNANTAGMKIRYGGVDIAGVQIPVWNNASFVPVSITIATDGALTVLVSGTNVFGSVTLPWVPTDGRVGLYGRTGGQSQTHWVDDLAISVTTAGSSGAYAANFNSAIFGTVVLSNNVVHYSPAGDSCGTDTYYYLASDGQLGGISVGQVTVNIAESTPAAPVIVQCPANQVLLAGANCQIPLPDLTTELVATDNCCCVTVSQSPSAGTLLSPGATLVTFVVTDSIGLSATCQVTVAVSPAPVAITAGPTNLLVNAGATAEFNVVATGTPVLTYQWLKNGSPLPGQTGATLTLPNAQPADAGGYSVVVTESCGSSITSAVAILTINLPPVARNDAFATPPNTPLAIPVASLLSNDSDADGGTVVVTGVTSPSRAGGTVALVAGVVNYTPPTDFVAGDTFTYAIADGQGGTASATVCVVVSAANLAYAAPAGGWRYIYLGDSAIAGANNSGFTSLDGSWSHDNGSDAWALDGLGGTLSPFVNPPGGVVTLDGYLRVQDSGDPRSYGFAETNATGNAGSVGSNRKIYFGRDITSAGAAGTVLNDGVTLSFRARVPSSGMDELYPSGGVTNQYPGTGDGYLIHDGGKGHLGIRQASGGTVSFALAAASDTGGPAGLVMNNLNGTAVSGTVDSGEAGTVNLLTLDPVQWHEFWITIVGDTSGGGTHRVAIYVDGSTNAQVFHVTAGNGAEGQFGAISYLAIGAGSTGQGGAVDVDFFGFTPGVLPPGALGSPEHPQMTIARQGTDVVISWSQTCGNFVLEQTGSLTPPASWLPVTAPVVPVGSRYQVTVSATGTKFFRLRQP